MRLTLLLSTALVSLPCALAQAQTWWQCGGLSWSGPTTCYPGVNCVILNQHFSQCIPECTAPVSTTSGAPVPTTTSGAASTTRAEPPLLVAGNSILALDGWAAGSYVQKASDSDMVILGPASTKGQFVTGKNSSIRMISGYYGQCLSFPYLNVKSAETSYKPLAFEVIGTSLDWSFNGTDNTLNTPQGFNTFVTCSDGALYLQTGADFPSGNCTTTRLKSAPY